MKIRSSCLVLAILQLREIFKYVLVYVMFCEPAALFSVSLCHLSLDFHRLLLFSNRLVYFRSSIRN